MTERAAEDWLIRYLFVMVISATALLALVYGLVFEPNLAVVGGALLALAAMSAIVTIDLRSWRAT